MLGENGAIGVVVSCCKHLLDIGYGFHAPFPRSPTNVEKGTGISRKNDNGLNTHRRVKVVLTVFVRGSDDARIGPGDTTHQEGGDIELLPGGKVITNNDGDFGVEHM